jgi:hypothetical protein
MRLVWHRCDSVYLHRHECVLVVTIICNYRGPEAGLVSPTAVYLMQSTCILSGLSQSQVMQGMYFVLVLLVWNVVRTPHRSET